MYPSLSLSLLAGRCTEIFIHMTLNNDDFITFSKIVPYGFNSSIITFKDGGYYNSGDNYLITIKLMPESDSIISYFGKNGVDVEHSLFVWIR